MKKKKFKVSQTMGYDRKNRTVIPNDDAAATILAQGHSKSDPITKLATVGNNRRSVRSAGSEDNKG